jgi:hypothetical protein
LRRLKILESMRRLLKHSSQISRVWVFACALVLYLGCYGSRPIGATASALRCDSVAISDLFDRTGPADARGAVKKLAELNGSIATALEQCYYSGKAGGTYFGSSPLWDLLQAAGALSSSSASWRLLKNNKQQCEVLQNAIRLYAILLSDTSVSKPPSVNNEVRQIAPAGLRTARHLAQSCRT